MLRRLVRRISGGRTVRAEDWPAERAYWLEQIRGFYRTRYGLDLHPLQTAPELAPPLDLVLRVQQANKADPDGFFASGYRTALAYHEELLDHGFEPRSFGRILELGVGLGRLLVHFAPLPAELHGCDVTPEVVEWTRRTLAGRASVVLSPTHPPLPYADGHFDFVYANSVFTHVPCAMMVAWVAELRRILRPGGALILSTLDANHYLRDIPFREFHRRYESAGCCDWDAERGVLMGNYMGRRFLFETWGAHFDVRELRQHYRDQSHLVCVAR